MTKAYRCDSCEQMFPGEPRNKYPITLINEETQLRSNEQHPRDLCPICLAAELEAAGGLVRQTAEEWHTEAGEEAKSALERGGKAS